MVSQVLFPVDAIGRVEEELARLFGRLADGLDEAAGRLGDSEDPPDEVARAVREATAARGEVEAALRSAREVGRTARLRPGRRGTLGHLEAIAPHLAGVTGTAEAVVEAAGRLGPGETQEAQSRLAGPSRRSPTWRDASATARRRS